MEQTTIEASKLEAYAIAAKEVGVPRDQFTNFATGGYVALDGFLPFHAAARTADRINGPEWVALGGKRGPGKSLATMAQVGLDDCQRMPNLKVLFLRKVQKAATESLDDIIRQVFRYTPHEQNMRGIRFPNGSRIIIGGFKNDSDIEKYLGLEYDVIVLEEATQISETKKDKLRGSLRTSKAGWRPRIYLNTNPDGIGLKWFKEMFVIPSRQGTETKTYFLDVSHIHNPFVNQEYHDWLDGLKGPLGKAWREGDWDAFANMAFPMWNYEKHVIQPFDIPDHWPKWRAVDWGSAAPFCCLWLTKNPDTNRKYVYRELYRAGLTTKQQARLIVQNTLPNERISFTFADPSMWAKQNKDDVYYSSADQYKDEGVPLVKADNERIAGKRKVDDALSDIEDGEPGLQIFETCVHLIEQLSSLPRDPNNVEDVDTDAEEHSYDSLRYSMSNEKRVEKDPTAVRRRPTRNPLSGIKGL